MNTIISQQTRQALAVGMTNLWLFRVVGTGEVPNEPTYRDKWWFEPLTAQNIPSEGKRRLDALRKARVPIKGVVYAHEAPKLLMAPKPPKPDFKISSSDIVTALGDVARVILTVFGVVFALFFQAILVDPALIVVLEDGTWVEVMTWYE